jgi:hypothetical protein
MLKIYLLILSLSIAFSTSTSYHSTQEPGFWGRLINFHDHGGEGVSQKSLKIEHTGFYWTDHTTKKNEELTVKKLSWYYEHRNFYKHSFVVLEAYNDEQKPYFYASEKNDFGVVWFKLPKHTTKIKLEHDGTDSGRTPVTKFKEIETNVKLGELKHWSKDMTNYNLLN